MDTLRFEWDPNKNEIVKVNEKVSHALMNF